MQNVNAREQSASIISGKGKGENCGINGMNHMMIVLIPIKSFTYIVIKVHKNCDLRIKPTRGERLRGDSVVKQTSDKRIHIIPKFLLPIYLS